MLRTSAIVLATLIATPAYADLTSGHVTASGETGITDNVFSASGDTRAADMFFTLRPGFLFSINRPRFIQELQGEGELIYYLGHQSDPSLGVRGGYRAFVTTGPRSEMMWALNGGRSTLSAINSRPSPDQAMVQVQPNVNVVAIQGDASESGSWVATRELRLSQTLFGRYSRTDDQLPDVPDPFGMAPPVPANTVVTSYEGGGSVALERSFRDDAISLEPGVSVIHLERVVGAAVTPPTGMGSRLDRQINLRARAQWRHDLNRTMSTSIDGGAVYVMPYGTDPNRSGETSTGVFPVIGGQLNYIEYWGSTTLALRRDVTPNMFLAQNTVTDSATLSAAVPIPQPGGSRRREPKLMLLGTLGGQRTQLVDPSTGKLASDFRALRFDVALGYTPRPGFTYSARYELTYQSGDKSGMTPADSFYRNTIYFSFALRYPSEVAVTMPKRRGSSRADRSDTAVGAEPVVPDVLDQSGGDDQGNR